MTRGHGEGSIYRRADGYWIAQVEAGRDANGKRRYSRAVRRRRVDALEALKQLNRHRDLGVVPTTTTVADYVNLWLDDVAPTTVTPITIKSYRKVARSWVNPYVGQIKLAKLTPNQVAGMLTALERDGKSARSRRYALTVLRRALGSAVRSEIVPRNVAALVDGPKLPRPRKDALTADEARLVLAQAAGDRWEALAVLALKLGLRQGELLALKWADVDLEARELVVADSKTDAGLRTIPILDDVAAVLRQHRSSQREDRMRAGPLWRDGGHVFTWEDGRPISARSCLRWWHELTEAAGIGRRRFHASRHTCATLLLEADVPLEVVSAVLGHANLSITADIYGRIGADAKRRALTRLDERLS
jgi:integrase